MPVYDYFCEKNKHLIEKRVPYDTEGIECPICGEKAVRLFTAQGQTFTGDLPTGAYCSGAPTPRDEKRYDVSLFQEACAERAHAHDKQEQQVGKSLPADNLWGEAKARANRIIKGQEAPVTSQTRFKSRKE